MFIYMYMYIYIKRGSFLVLVHTLISPDLLATALFTLKAQASTKEINVSNLIERERITYVFCSQIMPVLPTVLRTLTFKIVQRIFFIPCSKYHLEQDDTKNPEPHMEVPVAVSFSICAQ
uniref:Uncharacterized protein n=1 Tax=Micrurus surinamensis TaxID=129470 RepID=A0A2D4PQH2_MICSU